MPRPAPRVAPGDEGDAAGEWECHERHLRAGTNRSIPSGTMPQPPVILRAEGPKDLASSSSTRRN